METRADSQCPHTVEVGEIHKIRNCIGCETKYRQEFIAPIPTCQNKQQLFKLLQNWEDIAKCC